MNSMTALYWPWIGTVGFRLFEVRWRINQSPTLKGRGTFLAFDLSVFACDCRGV